MALNKWQIYRNETDNETTQMYLNLRTTTKKTRLCFLSDMLLCVWSEPSIFQVNARIEIP